MKTKAFTISAIPGEYERRVFIGGNYDSMPGLREIEKFVKDLKFVPVLAYDCNIPRSQVHDYTLLLLHSCKFAIFEIIVL